MKITLFLAVSIVIAGFLLPQEYTVTRELVIRAPANVIHQQVENMDSWEQWTTWNEVAPPAGSSPVQMQSGVGSGKYLAGTSGSGWFVITNNSVVDGFEYAIYSDDGDKSLAIVSFLDLGGETKVNWTVRGRVKKPPVLAPYIALSKDFTLGSSLNQSLNNLKKIIEQAN